MDFDLKPILLEQIRAHRNSIAEKELELSAKIILPHIGAGESEMLVCGMALGYADPADKVNGFHTPREPVGSFTTWLE